MVAVKRAKTRHIPSGLAKIHKADKSEYCKALFFAPHGHGKTHLLATADQDERTAPTLLLNFEGGERTIVGTDVDIFDVRSWDDYDEAYEILTHPDCKYRSVSLDSISETQIFGILRILETDKKRPDPDMMGQPDWGVILVQMRRLVRHFRDLPMHVFFTALAGEIIEPRVGTVKAPLLQGAFQKELPGIVDVVGYLANEDTEDDDVNRILLLHSYPKFQVKARTPWDIVIPTEIEDIPRGHLSIGTILDTLGYK